MNESLLVNALGHSAGVLIFGIFLFLLIQDRSGRKHAGGLKSILAATLALAWNLISLIVLGTAGTSGTAMDLTVTAGFSVLSLLPAVLLDLSLESRQGTLIRFGYALSFASIALHVTELFRPGEFYHRAGLNLITAGFGSLTVFAASGVFLSHQENRRAATSRLIGTMALFLLAISFVHLGGGHAQQIWSQELAFHHAAIPLALMVLMQDYRFVLLDAFLRFLANVLLAALLVSGVAAAWSVGWIPSPDTPLHQAILLAGACLLLITFAVLRSTVQRLLTRFIFHRSTDHNLTAALKTAVRNEAQYVQDAAAHMGRFVGASARAVEDAALDQLHLAWPVLLAELPKRRSDLDGIEAIVPLRVPTGRARYVLLGRRTGGRRYLSEDLRELTDAAAIVSEQLEQFRESELRRLVSQAELRALQSQIHPHFLFNALNTLYGIIPRQATGARETVLNLADIFRYFLETRRSQVPLEEELRIVRAYLDIERLRLGAKLQVEFAIADDALHVPIPILSLQPLVENAVKHAIAPAVAGGLVRIEAALQSNEVLTISVSDTGPGFCKKSEGGVGMENVSRRLELSYGSDSRLDVESTPGGSRVSFQIPVRSDARMAGALS